MNTDLFALKTPGILILGILVFASGMGQILKYRCRGESAQKTIANLNARTNAWWIMVAVLALAFFLGKAGSLALFTVISFGALREFLKLLPLHKADQRLLIWVYFVFTPLQYYLVWIEWYGLFSILIPVYAFLFIPTRSTLAGDCENFLERAAKLQWALMICVYSLSHVPGLLMLEIPGYDGGVALIFYLIFVTQISDVLQYVFGKLFGHRKIAPQVSPNKTWAGFVGGVVTAAGLGTLLHGITPFSPGQAAGVSLVLTLAGFAGGLTMSAIKRDRGIKDFGTLIDGHGGFLDRVDSICFAAPVYFHIIRYGFTV